MIIDKQKQSDADVKAVIGKAKTSYLQYENILNFQELLPKSDSSIPTLEKFKCTELKLEELLTPPLNDYLRKILETHRQLRKLGRD
ncbi:unnamed protein product [Schistosoma mattheei]|uniref:Uncharacterized protein n=1 Tax=Schistosoma mattheei TaxID=31246 RepID=A0A183PLF2_9TREM|nr:unnamed protein product [Schistosoma mattheei]